MSGFGWQSREWLYPLIMVLALVAGGVLTRASQKSLPLAWWQKLAVGLGAFCGAMFGAKLPFLFLDLDGFCSGAAWIADGKTIVTGMAGAYLGVEVAKWALQIRVKTGDSLAMPAAVSLGIGRLACLAGGCCFGAPTSLPWGLRFELAGDMLPRHPIQLYESAFHFSCAGALYVLGRRGIWQGNLAKAYILSYFAFRFATEFIRPEPRIFLGLTAYQWGILALAPVFAYLWIKDATLPAR